MQSYESPSVIASLERRIRELEAENEYLKKLLSISQPEKNLTPKANIEYIGNNTLKDAIEKINSNKWVEASLIIAKQYGRDFMIKESINFSILKKAMYEFHKMPEAPLRTDKSREANMARESRKNIRAKVYTYIDRMGDYYMKQMNY